MEPKVNPLWKLLSILAFVPSTLVSTFEGLLSGWIVIIAVSIVNVGEHSMVSICF